MKNKKLAKLIAGIFLAAAALRGEASAATTDFIVNGTFAEHSVVQTGWNVSIKPYQDFYGEVYGFGHFFSGSAPDVPNVAPLSLTQNVLDVAGGIDTLSFDLVTGTNGPNALYYNTQTGPGIESVLWNNTVIANLSNQTTTHYSYNVTATGHDTLAFVTPYDKVFVQNNGYSDGITLSNVSLIGNGNIVPAVPEPAPVSMLLIGVGLIGWIARRKTTTTA